MNFITRPWYSSTKCTPQQEELAKEIQEIWKDMMRKDQEEIDKRIEKHKDTGFEVIAEPEERIPDHFDSDEQFYEYFRKHLSTKRKFTVIMNNQMSDKEERVNHPSHYTWLKEKCGIEVIDITRHLDFNSGNAVKYILRAGHKKEADISDLDKEIEDTKKAIWYLQDKVKMLENARNSTN